jgi:1,5-anhydro-D-fructose reductase (1,5-anhydro-D-mannitol-forming)
MNPLNIAVLSFAHGHANAYCDVIATFDDAKVVAAWDDNPERGQVACEKYGLDFHRDLSNEPARRCHRSRVCGG